MRRGLLTIVLASLLSGCGSASSPHGAHAGIAVRSGSQSPSTAPGPISASTAASKTGSPVPATATGASRPRSTAAPATTTPVNLQPSKKRKGPRSISVAEPSSPIEPKGGRSAAQQLVAAWKGRAVAAADPNAVLVQRHLTSLSHKCTEPEAAIAGYVRSGIQKYRKYGVIESPVEFSRALDSAVPPGRSNCKIILRTLLAQVEQG